MTPLPKPHAAMNDRHAKGWMSLSLAVATITFIWTIVLPWLGTRPAVRAHIDHLGRQGIDPAAMYYSDIPAMSRLEADLAAKRAEHPEAFWGGGEH
jgi:hypothetical protein